MNTTFTLKLTANAPLDELINEDMRKIMAGEIALNWAKYFIQQGHTSEGFAVEVELDEQITFEVKGADTQHLVNEMRKIDSELLRLRREVRRLREGKKKRKKRK